MFLCCCVIVSMLSYLCSVHVAVLVLLCLCCAVHFGACYVHIAMFVLVCLYLHSSCNALFTPKLTLLYLCCCVCVAVLVLLCL